VQLPGSQRRLDACVAAADDQQMRRQCYLPLASSSTSVRTRASTTSTMRRTVSILTDRIVDDPVFIPLAQVIRAGFPAAHRDDDIGISNRGIVELRHSRGLMHCHRRSVLSGSHGHRVHETARPAACTTWEMPQHAFDLRWVSESVGGQVEAGLVVANTRLRWRRRPSAVMDALRKLRWPSGRTRYPLPPVAP
jgi:hypothetical protein